MATITPEIPVVNAGLLYINGLNLSVNATTTLINVAAGQCRDSSDINDITIGSVVVANLATRGLNGLDVGTVAASTLYAVYAIGSSTNQPYTLHAGQFVGRGATTSTAQTANYSTVPAGVILSASFVQPVLPAGYDMFRRIGAITTTAGSIVADFAQTGGGSGRRMWYGAAYATSITAGTSGTYAAVGLNAASNCVPIVPGVIAYLNTTLTPSAAGHQVFLQPLGAATASVMTSMSGDVAAVAHNAQLSCPIGVVSGVANINYKVTTNGSDSVVIQVAGYEDIL